MPGVPPDAVAQVKKGLRGLFNRKKQKAQQYQQGQHEPTAASNAPTSTTTTAAAAAPASTAHRTAADGSSAPAPAPAPAPPQAASAPSPAHHIAQPSGVDEAKDIDLNPSSAVSEAPTQTAAAKTETAPAPISKTAPAVKAEPSTGMSATSGPLGDHMAEVFTDVDSTADAKGVAEAAAAATTTTTTGEKV
ncbi:hypothetical protein N7G274_002546 [Stereocaulon virgatum]|uniref:Uncharacterized protein n=1 Tax=Stereocaulon virgatum TaxID=373712 RepID=A0ABR4AGY0_9LECA